MVSNPNQDFNIRVTPATPEFHLDADDVLIIHDCGVGIMGMRGNMMTADGATS